jgi:hypothetical protein
MVSFHVIATSSDRMGPSGQNGWGLLRTQEMPVMMNHCCLPGTARTPWKFFPEWPVCELQFFSYKTMQKSALFCLLTQINGGQRKTELSSVFTQGSWKNTQPVSA